MSALGTVGSVLAWPSDSGVAGGTLLTLVLGVPGYLHTHAVLRRHHQARTEQAERLAADARVSAGAGSNPAGAGLPADQRVVPPAAAKRKRGA